jgi:hypothetical protein
VAYPKSHDHIVFVKNASLQFHLIVESNFTEHCES